MQPDPVQRPPVFRSVDATEPIRSQTIEAFPNDSDLSHGMRFEVTVDDDGSISKLTIERRAYVVDENGDEVDADWDGGREVRERIRAGEKFRRIQIGEPITSTFLRYRVRIGELADSARSALDYFSEFDGDLDWVAEMSDGEKRRRRDLFLAGLAARYERAAMSGSRSPAKDLAKSEDFAKSDGYYTRSTIRNYISEARARGLLTGTSGGQGGGRLTPKAVAILRESGVEK